MGLQVAQRRCRRVKIPGTDRGIEINTEGEEIDRHDHAQQQQGDRRPEPEKARANGYAGEENHQAKDLVALEELVWPDEVVTMHHRDNGRRREHYPPRRQKGPPRQLT